MFPRKGKAVKQIIIIIRRPQDQDQDLDHDHDKDLDLFSTDHTNIRLPNALNGRNAFDPMETRVFRCVLASLYDGLSVRRSIGPSVRPLFGHAFVKNKGNQYF